jgi:hypothetical protein
VRRLRIAHGDDDRSSGSDSNISAPSSTILNHGMVESEAPSLSTTCCGVISSRHHLTPEPRAADAYRRFGAAPSSPASFRRQCAMLIRKQTL